MRPPEPLVRLPGSHERGAAAPDLATFESLAPRAPFPRWQGRFRNFGEVIEVELESGPNAAADARAAIGVLEGDAEPDVLDDLRLLAKLIPRAGRLFCAQTADPRCRRLKMVAVTLAEVLDRPFMCLRAEPLD